MKPYTVIGVWVGDEPMATAIIHGHVGVLPGYDEEAPVPWWEHVYATTAEEAQREAMAALVEDDGVTESRSFSV